MGSLGQLVPADDPRSELQRAGRNPVVPADRIDLTGSVQFFRRRLGLIIGIMLLGILAGGLISLLSDKVFTASAMVSLEPPTPTNQEGRRDLTAGPPPTEAFLDTQAEIITSRSMAEQVAQELGLLDGVAESERSAVIERVRDNVAAERSGESYALRIIYEDDEGVAAAAGANEYARQFTQWELRNTRARDSETVAAIEDRLVELRAQAQADTAALQSYRIANNLLSTSGESLTEQEISSYNQEVTRARAQASEDRARLNTALGQLRSGSMGDDVGEALGSSVVSSLRQQESTLAADVANLSSRYGPNHPTLQQAQSELAEVRERIQAEIERVISNLRAQVAVSDQRLTSLEGSLSGARARLSQSNRAMVGLDELLRSAEASQGLYEAYLNNYKELVAGEGMQQPNARILSLAEAPRFPSSPNIPMNLALATVIGLGLGLLCAFIAETFFRGVTTPEDVESETGLRFLGSIPLLSSVRRGQRDSYRAIIEDPRSPFSESFRSLMTSVEQTGRGPTQILALTSALPKEGKTVTSTCLAQVLAMSGKPTLLIDCDFARQGVSRLLNLGPDTNGLLDVLNHRAKVDEALLHGANGLSIMPIGRKEGDELGEKLADEEFAALLDGLRERFAHIVLDLPPILPIAAARRMASMADATIMLVRWRKTNSSALQAALQQMPADKINLAGVAMTQVDLRKTKLFGRTDPYFYYRQYREYYT